MSEVEKKSPAPVSDTETPQKPIWILKMKVNGRPTIAYSWDGSPSKAYQKYLPVEDTK